MNRFRSFNQLQNYIAKRLKPSTAAGFFDVEAAEWKYYIDHLSDGMIAFDVGANVGLVTLLFSRFVRKDGQVHSFEAASSTFERLSRVVEQTGCTNVTLNHAAVADRAGTLQLHLFAEHSSFNSLAARPLRDYGIAVDISGVEDVPALTIDGYCESHHIEQIDLLKIDVEGAEYLVLQGAHRMLAEKRVAHCVFEFNQTWADMGVQTATVENYLREVGYRLTNIISGQALFQSNPQTGMPFLTMCVATPN